MHLFALLLPFVFLQGYSTAAAQDDRPSAAIGNSGSRLIEVQSGIFALAAGCGCLLALAGFALQVAMLVFVYKDAQARGAEPMLWLVLVFFTHFVGFIVWMCVRPPLLKPR